MITYAKKEDLEEIIEVFNKNFVASKEFTDVFFENFYKYENTLVYKISDKIVSMLQMIPYKTNIGDATYIYSACTNKEYRKQGIMDKLLEKSFEIGKEKGHICSFLIPEEKWLFDFYKKYGYEPSLKIEQNEYISLENSLNDIKCREFSLKNAEMLVKIYNIAMKNDFFIKRDEKDFINQTKFFDIIEFYNEEKIIGYAFYYKDKEKYIFEEIITQNFENSLQSACDFLKTDKIIYKTSGNTKELGCVKIFDDGKITEGYVNLVFN